MLYSHAQLPQMRGGLFLTDGGIETSLIFNQGQDLPLFASYVLLETEQGREALKSYYRPYLALADRSGRGFILESPTWRCSRDWGAKLGHGEAKIAELNRAAIALMEELRDEFAALRPAIISGNIGPRGDGYAPERQMGADEAQAYHRHQVQALAETAAEIITAATMTHTGEAIGIVRAAVEVKKPVVISFTTETDGRLPSGEALGAAIEAVDEATDGAPAYYMINCAHPDHFRNALEGDWRRRIRGIRANASRKSHAELDESETLDPGNPVELAEDYRQLRTILPNLNIFGGCCGTDHTHIEAIHSSCLHAA